MTRFKRGEYQCAYRNERPGVEKEHVIPRSFFDTDDNGKRIIVPACEECNDKFSMDEEYVRMVFTMDLRGGQHPTARSLMNQGKAYRALQQNRKLLKSLFDTMHEVRLRTHGGIELPDTYHAFELERPKVDRFIDKVVRGVFFFETGGHLPKNYSVVYWTDDTIDIAQIPEEAKNVLLLKPLGIAGNNVFQYRFAQTTEDPMSTFWIMRFYEGLIHVALTRAMQVEQCNGLGGSI